MKTWLNRVPLAAMLVVSRSLFAAALPFDEDFESLAAGSVNNQNGWAVQRGEAIVQSGSVQSGTQALEVPVGSVSRALSVNEGNNSCWLTFHSRYSDVPDQEPSAPARNTSISFFVNANQNLVVYSNRTPVVLNVRIASNAWTRFDVYCDYDAMTWNLGVNETNVAAGLPLYSTNALSSLLIENNGGSSLYVDDIAMDDEEPTARVIDSDGDGMPDWWEQMHFSGVTNAVPSDDPDHDGKSNMEEYIAVLNPHLADWFDVAMDSNRRLYWTAHPSRSYSVYWSEDLTEGFTLLQANVPWSPDGFEDALHDTWTNGFYQLRVGLE